MCGILGVGGDLLARDHNVFFDLLAVSWLRGHDSTGVYSATKNGPGKMLKEICSPTYYLANFKERRQDVLNRWDTTLLLGHTRWATMGLVNKENAHPFYAGPYVGAHNGTLLEGEFWDFKITDSELLFMKMASTRDIVGTLKNLNPMSAFAVSVYEPGTKTLFLSRNTKRPLSFGFCNDRPVFYWASELGALRYILDRNGIDSTICTIPANKLWKIDMSKKFDFENVLEYDVTSPHKPYKIKEEENKSTVWDDIMDQSTNKVHVG
ncbi:MAG: hypothetical protein E6R03_05305 [Hyphomicrobiaceae bacterium]|nr:MAG: hypothetical protein E6R03_05305 [Hyphomicrobiaceae bacterium]